MKDYCKHVLFVGPHYSLRGGMASVLAVYRGSMRDFNFLPTYYKKNPLLSILYFTGAVLKFTWMAIFNRQIRIVHIHAACRGSFIRKSIMVLLAKALGKKTILHLYGGEFKVYYETAGFLKPYILYTLNAADELIVLSEEWKTYFDSITRKKQSVIVNNPVQMPAQVFENKVELPIPVLYLNHVTVKKGIFNLVEVFKKNKEIFKGVFTLNIAGAGADLERLQAEINEHQLQDLVVYKGWVSGEAKDSLISDCNLFVLPSYYEGLPMSILESMAFGKPVISTNVGGIPQVVKPGVNGWLAEPGDTAALENIFLQVKADPEVLYRYGSNSLRLVQDYSVTSVIAKLNGLYGQMLEGQTAIQQPGVYENAN